MEIFLAVIELVFIFTFAETSINDGLPDWIPRDKGGIDIIYRIVNVLGVWLALGCRQILIGIVLFIIAYGIKKMFWKNKYGDYLT